MQWVKVTNAHLIAAMVDLARREFYYFCRFMMPKVYREDRPHLKQLCEELQEFTESDEEGVIINMPPRHGKTLTVELLVQWFLGKNRALGVMVACYNELLSSRFSKVVRGSIEEIKASDLKLVFSDYFPGLKIKKGDGAAQIWALEDSHFSFLATSPGGTATGVGCQLLIIDDLIKNAQEAFNERVLESHWEWYNNTIMSRLEAGAKKIVIQTRWSERDLSGVLLTAEPEKWRLIKMKAQNDDGSMLCESMLSKSKYEAMKLPGGMDPVILAGNYQQEPFDSTDKLYGELKIYQAGLLPTGRRESYFDTADEGNDFLAGACYVVANNSAYVTDLIYTQDAMEITEGQAALMLKENNTSLAWIESNNGGRGYARNVERIMREIAGYSGCRVRWFHQGENKMARILANSTNVMNSIFMPADWKTRWPAFYSHVTKAGRRSKLLHDDFADLLTGIVEKSLTRSIASVPTQNIRNAIAF